jgi:hypothetical protein
VRTKGTLSPFPRLPRPPKLPKDAPHIFSRGPKALQGALGEPKRLDSPGEVPRGIVATKPEWAIYWALERLGKVPDVDFSFQSSRAGGRLEFGGAVLDFLLYDPPYLGINVQGIYWHYQFGGERRAHDAMVRMMIESYGVHLIYIDEDDAYRNPIYYTREALAGRDHSRMTEA